MGSNTPTCACGQDAACGMRHCNAALQRARPVSNSGSGMVGSVVDGERAGVCLMRRSGRRRSSVGLFF